MYFFSETIAFSKTTVFFINFIVSLTIVYKDILAPNLHLSDSASTQLHLFSIYYTCIYSRIHYYNSIIYTLIAHAIVREHEEVHVQQYPGEHNQSLEKEPVHRLVNLQYTYMYIVYLQHNTPPPPTKYIF